MVFFKPLLLVAGACLLYSWWRGDGDSPSPPPSPPPPQSHSFRQESRTAARPPPPPPTPYSPPAPARQTTGDVCHCAAHPLPHRHVTRNATEQQRLTSTNLARHLSQTKSSPTEPYRSQDQQYPKIDPPRNAEASNEDDERDPHYLHLRNEAKKYYALKVQLFDESRQAYSRKEGARAKELSKQARECEKRMKEFDEQAGDWIFKQNNKGNRPYAIDLHGLYVKEAVSKAKQSLREARARNDPFIQFIVGKGLHAKDGKAKIKPAIEKFIRESGLSSRINQSNTGVLIVDLDPVTYNQASSSNMVFRDRTNLVF